MSHKIITTIIQGTITIEMTKTTKYMTTEGTSAGMITIIVEDFQVKADTSRIGRIDPTTDPVLYVLK